MIQYSIPGSLENLFSLNYNNYAYSSTIGIQNQLFLDKCLHMCTPNSVALSITSVHN